MGHFIGNTPAVTVQDFQLAKDLFNREEWCGRSIGIINRYFRSDTGVSKVMWSIFLMWSIAPWDLDALKNVDSGNCDRFEIIWLSYFI